MIKCEPIRCGSHFSIPKRDLVQKAEVTLLKGIPEKKIKAVGFDVGHTLIQYKNPLNWQGLYRYGLERAAAATGITLSENRLLTAEEVLLRYNTRVNYREWEVDSDCIFGEILEKWDCSADLHVFESAFYSFFKADAEPYPETMDTMRKLKQRGIRTGILTDVAYGMDNEFSLQDIVMLSDFFDAVFTSVDIGYRKPNPAGYIKLLDSLEVSPDEMMFVGDEEKDVTGANRLGITSVLINRGKDIKNFGQNYTVESLNEIFEIMSGSDRQWFF